MSPLLNWSPPPPNIFKMCEEIYSSHSLTFSCMFHVLKYILKFVLCNMETKFKSAKAQLQKHKQYVKIALNIQEINQVFNMIEQKVQDKATNQDCGSAKENEHQIAITIIPEGTVIHPFEWIPNKSASARCPLSQQNETEFDSEAKGSFILYQRVEKCILLLQSTCTPQKAVGRAAFQGFCQRGGGGVLACGAQACCTLCPRLRCRAQHLCTRPTIAMLN